VSLVRFDGDGNNDESDLFNALDKGNLGNAETDGMSKGKSTFVRQEIE
jgi:hypothetical protein